MHVAFSRKDARTAVGPTLSSSGAFIPISIAAVTKEATATGVLPPLGIGGGGVPSSQSGPRSFGSFIFVGVVTLLESTPGERDVFVPYFDRSLALLPMRVDTLGLLAPPVTHALRPGLPSFGF